MNDAGTHLRGLARDATELTESGLTPQILCGPDSPLAGQPGERLSRVFEGLAAVHAAAPAVMDNGRVWTYREMDTAANRFAHLLAGRGVRPGDRVALLLDRSAETYIAILAVMKAG
ncbi:MAG: AMP-binding protein, partial [Rhizobiales bacterium]|nr:AMP-binding protein [Hyphomicrobiales bacterium]